MALPSGGTIRYLRADVKTQLQIHTKAGRAVNVAVERDATVPAKAAPSSVKVVAELPDKALIMIDTYASQTAGMSMCQAGEERFLRVLSIAKSPAKVEVTLKIASCRDNIEMASPDLEWTADTRTLRIHWLTPPKGQAAERVIQLNPEGKLL